jgi:hypothetical protein
LSRLWTTLNVGHGGMLDGLLNRIVRILTYRLSGTCSGSVAEVEALCSIAGDRGSRSKSRSRGIVRCRRASHPALEAHGSRPFIETHRYKGFRKTLAWVVPVKSVVDRLLFAKFDGVATSSSR